MNEKELDLGPIKERLKSLEVYAWDKDASAFIEDIASLVAEVERLREWKAKVLDLIKQTTEGQGWRSETAERLAAEGALKGLLDHIENMLN